MIITSTELEPRLCQGDIIRNIEYIEYVSLKEGIIVVSKINFPLIIVLTQDCDLEWDFNYRRQEKQNNDKLLISILVAPIYNMEHFRGGEHLSDLKLRMEIHNKNSTAYKNIMQNERQRYHYVEFTQDISISPSVIDFKHFFTVNVEYLKKRKVNNYVCKVEALYRENISQRFANYLSRIGLPTLAEKRRNKRK